MEVAEGSVHAGSARVSVPYQASLLHDGFERVAAKSLDRGIVRTFPLADAFPSGAGRIPKNPLIAAAVSALLKGGPRARVLSGGWVSSESGIPVYIHLGKRGGRIMVFPEIDDVPKYPNAAQLWAFVESLSPFTADVALAVLAQLCEPTVGDRPKCPLLESVPITAKAILKYKGMSRYGAERQLLASRVGEEMERLRCLRFDVEGYPAWNPASARWETQGVSWRGDRLFDIVKIEDDRGTDDERDKASIAWLVRAGQWAYWWLNAQGRVWVGGLSKALLELDHRENRGAALMAKRLGQHLSIQAGGIRSPTIQRIIARLLEDVGELPAPAHRSSHWAGRTRDRFDEALLALQEAGVFKQVTWPGGHGPGDADRYKGWVGRWLAAKVEITFNDPPESLRPAHRSRAVEHRPRRRTDAVADDPSPALIRRARINHGLSQRQLAQQLGIPPAHLSQIEVGRRLPSDEIRSKLLLWLQAERHRVRH